MKDEFDYLTIIEVLSIHKILIKKYGGIDGIRDMGALDSALYRPQTGYYDDIIAEAAALWESLSQNHPFFDGNKRTAFAVTYSFLSINGRKLKTKTNEVISLVNVLYAENRFEFKELEKWLRNHIANN